MGIDLTFNTLLAGGSVTIYTPAVVFGTDYADKRFNQYVKRTADGNLVTYDNGLNVVEGEIRMKGVTWSYGDLLRTWLHEKAIFGFQSFTISSTSGQLDLGLGKGVNVTGCNFLGDDDKGVFKYVTPGVYTITFPYTFVRT